MVTWSQGATLIGFLTFPVVRFTEKIKSHVEKSAERALSFPNSSLNFKKSQKSEKRSLELCPGMIQYSLQSEPYL